MQTIAGVVTWEVGGFLGLLLAIVLVRLLTGSVNTHRLLYGRRADGRYYFSPERVQLLVLTLGAAGQYVLSTSQVQAPHQMADVPTATLTLFGASQAVYLGGKAYAAAPWRRALKALIDGGRS